MLLGLLSGCAPVVRGSTALQPLRVAPGVPIEVAAGAQVFVELAYSYADFGYSPDDPELRAFRFMASSAQPGSNDVRSFFALREAAVPADWRLSLARATARRSPLQRGLMADAPAGVEYRLDLVLVLTVPADAAPGRYRPEGLLVSRNAGRAYFGFEVLVR